MKRIKIETADNTYYAKPLTLGQLEEHEKEINDIVKESAKIGTSGGSMFPVSLLKKQAGIVFLSLKNHDRSLDKKTMADFSIQEIVQAFTAVLSGSGLEEVPEGEAKAGL